MEEKYFERLREVFDLYPKEEKVILVDDGHVFLWQARSLAEDYARRNGLTYKLITRESLRKEENYEMKDRNKKK